METAPLTEVPGDLDPRHPWLKVGENRRNLTRFLEIYGVDASEVALAKFSSKWFEVLVRKRDENGKFVYLPNEKDIALEVHRYPYKEGMKPKVLRVGRRAT